MFDRMPKIVGVVTWPRPRPLSGNSRYKAAY